jgi:hypothetical protein
VPLLGQRSVCRNLLGRSLLTQARGSAILEQEFVRLCLLHRSECLLF